MESIILVLKSSNLPVSSIMKVLNLDSLRDIRIMFGHRGDNSDFDSRASGAYIFRPESQFPETLYVIGEKHA